MCFNWGRKTLHFEWFNLNLKSRKCLKVQSTFLLFDCWKLIRDINIPLFLVYFCNCVITLIYIALFLISFKFILMKYLALLLSKQIYFSNLKKVNCKMWYNGVWIYLSRMELWCVNYETMAYSSNEMQRNNYLQIKIELSKIKLNFVNICIKLLSFVQNFTGVVCSNRVSW